MPRIIIVIRGRKRTPVCQLNWLTTDIVCLASDNDDNSQCVHVCICQLVNTFRDAYANYATC